MKRCHCCVCDRERVKVVCMILIIHLLDCWWIFYTSCIPIREIRIADMYGRGCPCLFNRLYNFCSVIVLVQLFQYNCSSTIVSMQLFQNNCCSIIVAVQCTLYSVKCSCVGSWTPFVHLQRALMLVLGLFYCLLKPSITAHHNVKSSCWS